jgi:hypothetical protein
MFQFPGFALKPLCIQGKSTCLNPLLIPEGNNNRLSGGFPHSEIHGSKLILSSPWLIAEYHVLHRLLLPRHPPNALFALDLIQKKPGFFQSQKMYFPRPQGWFAPEVYLVSVLDLDSTASLAGGSPILGITSSADCVSLYTMSIRPVGRPNASSDALGGLTVGYGGACRDRTDDPLLAKQMLSQLS